MMAEFHFLRPLWLFALIPFWLMVWRYWRARRWGGAWSRVCDAALLPFVLTGRTVRGSRLTGFVATVAGTLAIVALAGPVWERLPVPVFRGESALVIALDLSASMNAEDPSPSRLQHAKFKIADILRLRTTGQTALVVFAAQSFVVTPLTDDTETLAAQLQALDTTMMPLQGTEPAAALQHAGQLLQQAGIPRGHVLLITDGADKDALERARTQIAAMHHRVSVLGVGTEEGAPIPDQTGGFLKSPDGEIIVSRLAVAALRALANSGSGMFLDTAADDRDLEAVNDLQNSDLDADLQRLEDLAASQWREFGPWLLLPLLPIAAFGFRRGLLLVLLAVIAPLVPIDATAAWWLTPDQAAQAAYGKGAYGAAAATFEHRGWRGAAQYRAGAYEVAVTTFSSLDDASAHYNRGNALARLGRFDEAVAAYEQTLEYEPEHADATFNKALIEELIREVGPPRPEGSDDEPADDEADRSERVDGGGQDPQDFDSDPPPTSDEQATPEGQEPEQEQGTAEQEERESESNRSRLGEGESDSERVQATEQWLRQIPDEPGGLLRRKFQYQYERLYGDTPYRGNGW